MRTFMAMTLCLVGLVCTANAIDEYRSWSAAHFLAHQVFGAANGPTFENVAALEKLPVKGTTVFAIPMKINGASGAPLRIFALLP